MVHTQFPSLAISLPDVQKPMKRMFTLESASKKCFRYMSVEIIEVKIKLDVHK